MNSDYKKAIGIFGIAIPVSILLLLTLLVKMKASSIKDEYYAKCSLEKKDKLTKMQIATFSKKVKIQKDQLEHWNALLSKEDRRTFLQDWKQVGKSYPVAEFAAERPVWDNDSSGIGLKAEQSSSEVSMSFNATFRAMQAAFLQVETKLPQMQLDSLEMKRSKGGETINFKSKHTVWTKE